MELGGSLIREVPGRVASGPDGLGRASTARWCGSGERDGEEYARNRRFTSLRWDTGSNLADLGRARCAPVGYANRELLGRFTVADREATRKVCGVLVAIPQGHSRAPPSSSESQ